MVRPRRVDGEYTDISFNVLLTPSEYLELRDAAMRAGETMSEYVRVAVVRRWERASLLAAKGVGFGERFRGDGEG